MQMNDNFRSSKPLYFSIPIGLLVIAAGIAGIFFRNTYSQETASWAVQGVGQDLANLIVAVPTLIVSALLIHKGAKAALFIWLGTTIFLVYTFVLYCFALHFNSLFLVYCGVLSLSFYAIVSVLTPLDKSAVKDWFDEKRTNNFAVYYLVIISILFFMLWMKQIVPALAAGEPPRELKENGLLTNPVHVLDLCFFLPGSVISAILLKKKNSLGYLFAPALTIFCAMMALTISLLVVVMKLNAVASDVSIAVPIFVVALIGFLAFIRMTKGIGKKNVDTRSTNF
jgi:hypothetical protein